MDRRKFLIRSSLWVGAVSASGFYWVHRWHYIVIHHSAGNYGNIEFLQKVHRQRQAGDPIDAIPYHYIIGNGNGLGMGIVNSDWRNDYKLWGMHVSANNVDRNYRGVGICLVGNYEKQSVPELQYQSLLALTKNLMATYSIGPNHVTGHGHTDGESTKCPGRFFPMERFKKEIS
ncbi:MAG: hypothetical protein GKR92_02765 [Gammaproteobacteria bacterium]|nr:MAG: hypothetical protein GKR92_02765 [Gammaproteobacteria bacterium]